jgi:hypothetical protein
MTWKVRFPIGLLAGWLAVGLACDSDDCDQLCAHDRDDCDDPAQVCDAELERCVAICASQPTSEWSFE